jgi:hypothetical protein
MDNRSPHFGDLFNSVSSNLDTVLSEDFLEQKQYFVVQYIQDEFFNAKLKSRLTDIMQGGWSKIYEKARFDLNNLLKKRSQAYLQRLANNDATPSEEPDVERQHIQILTYLSNIAYFLSNNRIDNYASRLTNALSETLKYFHDEGEFYTKIYNRKSCLDGKNFKDGLSRYQDFLQFLRDPKEAEPSAPKVTVEAPKIEPEKTTPANNPNANLHIPAIHQLLTIKTVAVAEPKQTHRRCGARRN